MTIESDADRLLFLDEGDFAVTATYTSVGGGAATSVKGIFDANTQAIEVGNEVAIASTAPQFLCRSADLTNGGRQQDTFVIDGTTYKAVDIQPDGTGMTTVRLQRAS